MDSKRRQEQNSKQKKSQECKETWKYIQQFVSAICEKDVESMTVYIEDNQYNLNTNNTNNINKQDYSPSQSSSKYYYIIKSYLRNQFQSLSNNLGYNLSQQIVTSFKDKKNIIYSNGNSINHDNNQNVNDNKIIINNNKMNQNENNKEQTELKLTRQSSLYNQMRHLGTNADNMNFSEDNRFILKGIPLSQFNTFKNNLAADIFNTNYSFENCLSAKILGLFEINDEDKWNSGILELPSNYFILMENVLSNWNFNHHIIKSIYDLKGSSVGRNYEDSSDQSSSSSSSSDSDEDDHKYYNQKNKAQNKQKENDENNNIFNVKFGKDNDFNQNNIDQDILHNLPEELKEELIQQLKNECKFYEQANIMDYSLMIIIAEKTTSQQQQQQNQQIQQQKQNKFQNINYNNYIISFGLIDYLTEYDLKKSLETTFKSLFCSNKDEISCVDPQKYYDRLIKYVSQDVLALQSNSNSNSDDS